MSNKQKTTTKPMKSATQSDDRVCGDCGAENVDVHPLMQVVNGNIMRIVDVVCDECYATYNN